MASIPARNVIFVAVLFLALLSLTTGAGLELLVSYISRSDPISFEDLTP